jgi:hypothetical protein
VNEKQSTATAVLLQVLKCFSIKKEKNFMLCAIYNEITLAVMMLKA